MSKFGLFVRFTVKEGEQETFVKILLEAAHSMEELKECEMYTVNSSKDEPNTVFVYEVWSSEKAHQASLGLDVTQRVIKRARPLITAVERIGTFNPEGGKWISTKE
jgi:quinol monooxygenase YgiN